jgi:uncharacterized protein YyaL (SSP411 family)
MSAPEKQNARTNALAQETSPYLLQHAHNPVQWYAWNEQSLDKARREDKPILLSIGYSACHWCHVMAHESFDDEATARVMNELFINIKVDREERPDLDKIYQSAYQLLNGRGGGWPLTMFLTPDDRVPFFAGTYFPNQPRHGMPAFINVLQQVATAYREQQDAIRQQNRNMLDILEHGIPEAGDTLSDRPLQQVRSQLGQAYDKHHAGFGQAPKFPHPTNLERLLRHWYASQGEQEDDAALEMVRMTLHAMAAGGIYDQLGGGFCRYSVDDYWMIPHFEKMLYDNGPLLSLYVEAWQAGGDGVFTRIAKETADWVMREMQSPEGGYYSTLDADSEGEEGKFYVWTPDQVRTLLSDEEYRVFAPYFGLDRKPNFEGKWHLHVFQSLHDIADTLHIDVETAAQRLSDARHKLLQQRNQRVLPGRDEKILTSWNGLMIRGMALAGRVLQEPRYLASAEQALEFIHRTLWRNNRLLATCKDGKAHLNAYLDDYVFLIQAILALLEARWRNEDLAFALQLADTVLQRFEDKDNGGFFFTSDDHEQLIQRPKPYMDDSLPAGNGVAAQVLLRLGHLLGEQRYLDAAERCLQSAWVAMSELPHGHNALLNALQEYLQPPASIILRGNSEDMAHWRQQLDSSYRADCQVFCIDKENSGLPAALADKTASTHGAVTAYLCRNFTCSEPVTGLATLQALL